MLATIFISGLCFLFFFFLAAEILHMTFCHHCQEDLSCNCRSSLQILYAHTAFVLVLIKEGQKAYTPKSHLYWQWLADPPPSLQKTGNAVTSLKHPNSTGRASKIVQKISVSFCIFWTFFGMLAVTSVLLFSIFFFFYLFFANLFYNYGLCTLSSFQGGIAYCPAGNSLH